MIVGGYTLDLYCDSGLDQPYGTRGHSGAPDDGGAYPGTFCAETGRDCRWLARKAGWKFLRGRRVICPTCVADLRYGR